MSSAIAAFTIAAACVCAAMMAFLDPHDDWYYSDIQQCLVIGGTAQIQPWDSVLCWNNGVIYDMEISTVKHWRKSIGASARLLSDSGMP